MLKFFQAGLGPQISACFAQVKVPRFIPSVSLLQLHGVHVYLNQCCAHEVYGAETFWSRPGVISFNHHFFWSCSCVFSSCLLLFACMCEEGKAWETNVEHHNKNGVKALKKIAKGGQQELHSHLNDASTKHWSPPRLHRWRKLENAYTNNFFWNFDENSRQWPPVRVSMDPPPLKEETWPPLQMPPPLSKEETRPGPLTWGGGGTAICLATAINRDLPQCHTTVIPSACLVVPWHITTAFA